MRAELFTNNLLSIDGRYAGQIMAVTENGQIQNATAAASQTKTQFRPLVAPATLGEPVVLDVPVYLSASPSSHKLNPAMVEAIAQFGS